MLQLTVEVKMMNGRSEAKKPDMSAAMNPEDSVLTIPSYMIAYRTVQWQDPRVKGTRWSFWQQYGAMIAKSTKTHIHTWNHRSKDGKHQGRRILLSLSCSCDAGYSRVVFSYPHFSVSRQQSYLNDFSIVSEKSCSFWSTALNILHCSTSDSWLLLLWRGCQSEGRVVEQFEMLHHSS